MFRTASDAANQFCGDLKRILLITRQIDIPQSNSPGDSGPAFDAIDEAIQKYAQLLKKSDHQQEAIALEEVRSKISRSPSYGGLGLAVHDVPTADQYTEIIFLTEAWLESTNSEESSRDFLSVNSGAVEGRRPMTLAQKIFTQHALNTNSSLSIGDVCRFGVDWIMASELSWGAMALAHEEMGSPGIWRNDRFWLAGDHVVHPTLLDKPMIKTYVETAEKAKREFKMTEYQGMNYTIMHTEFVRERAEPGMLILGSDSHTCSAGAVSCLGIGLGTADVMMTLSLGETWFKIPESVLIEFVGKPSFAISGKDVILHIFRELKRNTVAAERIVEFAGEGAQYLSCDARFAICNMATEFGAITGVFIPDAVTQDYINRRKRKANRSSSLYFRPDPGATYAERYTVDLSKVEPTLAIYPNPDDVVPVSTKSGMRLDGIFIGACTTTEEEMVLAALVLKVGLQKRLPLAKGKRHYVPGSLPIVEKLRELGFLEVFEDAGFTRGPPGCSLCVGLSAEKAAEGETWLSSQNRNFKNRMGKGSFGYLSSAVVCAASSFSMTVADPAGLLQEIDEAFFRWYKGVDADQLTSVTYVEPRPPVDGPRTTSLGRAENLGLASADEPAGAFEVVRSKVITLGDFIDTDALSPGYTLTTCKTEEEFGRHVLEPTYPEFRQKVAEGQRVVVGGRAFGCGSSRECAVSALKGVGVQAVIAKSFAFIFGRNQPNLGLLGIVMIDDDFYAAAKDGEEIVIDIPKRTISVAARSFPFQLSEIEYKLTQNKGVAQSYRRFGKAIWEKLTSEEVAVIPEGKTHWAIEDSNRDSRLTW
ncbi:hypothetical protein LTR49_024831 [Elasticomyces elasticus]|nr:hypothetical protein LTR49_024831 [Elasticomyces elasticus]